MVNYLNRIFGPIEYSVPNIERNDYLAIGKKRSNGYFMIASGIYFDNYVGRTK